MGAALASTVLGIQRPRVALLSNGTEAIKGTPLVQEAHQLLEERAASSPLVDFVGNTEGNVVMDGVADVVVADGFTGNVALKLIEGVSSATLRSIREAAEGSTRGKLGGLLLRGDLRALRAEIDPEAQGGAYLLGLRKLGVVPHGRFTRTGFSQAILLAARGVRNDVVGRTHAALEEAGALKGPAPIASASDSRTTVAADAMTREAVFTLIQNHLADELDVDAGRIEEGTRFKEDLEADSLDLYTLVQELEDSYGVKMTDEQAAQILSVGQAVDFVLAHAPSGAA